MSDTIIDLPKVSQMLDNGWTVQVCRNTMVGGYSVMASHASESVWLRARTRLIESLTGNGVPLEQAEYTVDLWLEDGSIATSDATPEQALTRLAYKVHGEVI